MSRDIRVVALGARTPGGLTAASAAAAFRAGVKRVAEHPFMVDDNGDRVVGAIDALLDPALQGPDRLIELASTALLEVVENLALNQRNSLRVACLVGVPELRPGFSESDATNVLSVLQRLDLPGLSFPGVEQFGRGHAAALAGIVEACRRIERGETELCIVGGVDSYLHYQTLDWLQEHRQLATADTRSAFHPGEGAGFVALASDNVRRRYGWESLAAIDGAAVAQESRLIKSDEDCFGEGLTAAVTGATATRRANGPIAEVYCDVNGERYRGEEWGFVLLRRGQLFRDGTDYRCPPMVWGDLGAASGALNVTLTAASWQRGWAKGDSALIWGSSEHGLRAAAVFRSGEEA